MPVTTFICCRIRRRTLWLELLLLPLLLILLLQKQAIRIMVDSKRNHVPTVVASTFSCTYEEKELLMVEPVIVVFVVPVGVVAASDVIAIAPRLMK